MPALFPTTLKFVVAQSADPAANTEISFTAAEDLLVRTFDLTLVTDANVANRQVKITVEDSAGNVYARLVAGGVQAASLTRRYSGVQGDFAAPAVQDDVFQIALGKDGLFVPKGGKIKTVTTNRQATDNFGALVLSAERF